MSNILIDVRIEVIVLIFSEIGSTEGKLQGKTVYYIQLFP